MIRNICYANAEQYMAFPMRATTAGRLHARHGARQQGGVGGSALQNVQSNNQPLGILGQEEGVAELHFGAGLLAHDDVDVRFIQAEDLFLVGHELALQDALAGLLAGLGQLLQDLVHPAQHLLGLGAGPVGLLPMGVEQLAIPAGVVLARVRAISADLPVVGGGLIETMKEVEELLAQGLSAVSTSNPVMWLR